MLEATQLLWQPAEPDSMEAAACGRRGRFAAPSDACAFLRCHLLLPPLRSDPVNNNFCKKTMEKLNCSRNKMSQKN